MEISVDFQEDTPLYRQILSQMKYLIGSGELKPGDQLPTIRELADQLEIHFNTVARVYKILDQEGLISTQHGRGTYLLNPPGEEAARRSKEENFEYISREYLKKAHKLGYSRKQILTWLEKWMKRNEPK